MKERQYLYPKLLFVLILGILVLGQLGQKSVQFLHTFDLNRIVTGFQFGKTWIADLVSYILYLLFDVEVADLESLLHYFLR